MDSNGRLVRAAAHSPSLGAELRGPRLQLAQRLLEKELETFASKVRRSLGNGLKWIETREFH